MIKALAFVRKRLLHEEYLSIQNILNQVDDDQQCQQLLSRIAAAMKEEPKQADTFI